MTTKPETYHRVARLYDILDLPFEHGRYKYLRPQMFEGMGGALLDAGVGTGRNIAYYPTGSQVTGIDISPAMLGRAKLRREKLAGRVELIEMDVANLAFGDDRFDGIVSTFLFCVLAAEMQLPALRELCRVCKPSGKIRILEYSLSRNPWRRFLMALWAPWVRLVYGAEFDRNTEQYLQQAGLELVESRFLFKDVIKVLTVRPMA